MTKNEVINKIYEEYYDDLNPEFDKKDIISHLLDFLTEEIGMLPPIFLDEDSGEFLTKDQVLDCGNLDGKFTWKNEE